MEYTKLVMNSVLTHIRLSKDTINYNTILIRKLETEKALSLIGYA